MLTRHRELLSPEPVIPPARVVHAFTASLYTVAMDETADYTLAIQIATRFLDEESEPDADRYVFAHTTRIRNLGRLPAQRPPPPWVLTDPPGTIEASRAHGTGRQNPAIE